ncbi:MAG: AI-2E family transporter [Limnobacter sp.]|nr:AI-2E family transporter [Limnobacter sp.]
MKLSRVLATFYREHWALMATLAVLLWCIVEMWAVFSPFLAAALISYLVSSPSNWLVKVTKGRCPYGVGAFSFVLLFFALVAGVFLLLVPVVLSQLELIESNLPRLLANVIEVAVPFLNNTFNLDLSENAEALQKEFGGFLIGHSESLAKVGGELLKSSSGSVLGLTGFLSLVVVASLFMAPAFPALLQRARSLLPPVAYARFEPIGNTLNHTLADYLKGIGIVVGFQGVFYATGLSLAGLQAGWAIGLLAGVFSLIPYVGLTLSCILAVLGALLELQGISGVLLVVGIFLLGQIIEGFILTPLLVGDKIGLSAITVVFALAFFGALFGIVGVVFALPLAACLRVLFSSVVANYRNSRFFVSA